MIETSPNLRVLRALFKPLGQDGAVSTSVVPTGLKDFGIVLEPATSRAAGGGDHQRRANSLGEGTKLCNLANAGDSW